MTDRTKIVAGIGMLLAMLLSGVAIGTCSHGRTAVAPEPVVDVDASAGDRVALRDLDAEIFGEQARIAQLEEQHREELTAMDSSQRADYQAHRAQGSSDLARWFKDRTRSLLLDGGT